MTARRLTRAATLRATTLQIGLVEGLAEATAMIVKVFSGTLSDFLGRRKALAVFRYGLGALCKPLFAVSGSLGAARRPRRRYHARADPQDAPEDQKSLLVSSRTRFSPPR